MSENNFDKQIGKNIRYKRKKRGLTIAQLAKHLEIQASFLGLIERGTRKATITNLVKIANFFTITLDELVTVDLEARAYVDTVLFAKKY